MSGASLVLDQSANGYRYNRDSFLLADFVATGYGGNPPLTILDVGIGVGVVTILLARAFPLAVVTGIDIEPTMVAIAADNSAANRLSDRVTILTADIREYENLFLPQQFDALVANPPYFKVGTGRISPDPIKAVARHELAMTLADLFHGAQHLLCQGGRVSITMIADRRTEYESMLAEYGFFEIRHRWVRSFQDAAPILFLSEATFGNPQQRCVMEPALVLKNPTGEDSADYAAIETRLLEQW
jgi:tRNA1Val (adenine37-N6)-methyltransferase